ncbi:MAG: homoserine O-acetyltransferase [Intrasporangium sp.]|uniref:homoserine O-acetyltransferase MetX n=1 Tax=Intrasporangium sp. TaxID=1925024 RepID=UPI002647A50F|nr:homoserine O-acetyltransferase [Intrasporangium sp.]MDN5795251.1 homoserine O-acetyltransferase [Intrasporangium sp.]
MTVTHRHETLTRRLRQVAARPIPTTQSAPANRAPTRGPDDGTWREGDPVGERRFLDLGAVDLERAGVLPQVRVAYETWGTLSPTADNVVLVEHALTGDSHVVGMEGAGHPTPGWWEGLVGPGRPLDTNRWFVVCTNVLGGCQGTTGPVSSAPDGRHWASRFPYITIRDQVQVEKLLLERLGIRRVAAVLGGSMGGMRTIEWAVMGGDFVDRAIVLASTAHATADQIAWAQPQLLAIRGDADFAAGDYYDTGRAPEAGLGIARRIAHITYRTETELNSRFGRVAQPGEDPLGSTQRGRFAVESYLDHHASKLTGRFDANSYLVLTEAMNSHDVGRGRGGLAKALARVTADCTIASVDTDRLYPAPLSDEMAGLLPTATRESITSVYGHDGFLIETEQVAGIIGRALRRRAC